MEKVEKKKPFLVVVVLFDTIIMKLLGQFHLNFICSLLAKGERKYLYISSRSHNQDGPMPIYVKNLEKSCSAEPLG